MMSIKTNIVESIYSRIAKQIVNIEVKADVSLGNCTRLSSRYPMTFVKNINVDNIECRASVLQLMELDDAFTEEIHRKLIKEAFAILKERK